MGAFDGAEVCELVGLYLLQQVKSEIKEVTLGLYRDDGLGLYNSRAPGTKVEQFRKRLVEIFKRNGLRITIECDLKRVDFLDVTLDLTEDKHLPYRKPDSDPLYIHKDSNHPPCIIRQLPNMINKRLCELSSDIHEFQRAKPDYEKALRNSGYKPDMAYMEVQQPTPRRRRKIIWFNPPYSLALDQNLGKEFLNILKRHFPKHPRFNKYHSIFNTNTVKLSYSCMPNMRTLISGHNKKLMKSANGEAIPSKVEGCNCRDKSKCPLPGSCLTSALVYRATVEADGQPTRNYVGLTEQTFKARFYTHKDSFTHYEKRNATSLSQHIWSLNEANLVPRVSWELLKRTQPYKCGARPCSLCNEEKLQI